MAIKYNDNHGAQNTYQQRMSRKEQSLEWGFVFRLLQSLNFSPAIMEDEGFKRRYAELLVYIVDKTAILESSEE